MDDELVGEEAQWSRAWEWPGWVRAVGRRGWRPDGRTLGVLLAIIVLPQLAGAIPLVKPAWDAAFHPPTDAYSSFSPDLRWERVLAGSYIGTLLSSALVVVAAALLIAAPRHLLGYAVAVVGLLAGLGTALALMLVALHLFPGPSQQTSYVADVAGAALLLLVTGYAASRRRTT